MIPPQELGMKTFNRAVRGYEPSEVDDYIEFLIGSYTDIYKQCEIYDKKFRLVAQRIAELQEREEEIHSKEDNISKTMMSSQMIHDKTIEEAQAAADNIILRAEKAADKILADARARAQTALGAVSKKTETQIEAARVKSESLYLASRTRCAKLLGDLKKELTNQKERMSLLKDAADKFNIELGEVYKKQFEAIKSASFYVPAIDFDRLSESRLFHMIMEEIKEDMAEIENKNREADYEFEKELLLLKDFDFADEHIQEYKAGANSRSYSNYNFKNFEEEENGEADNNKNEETPAEPNIYSAGSVPDISNNADEDDEDEDVKVFAGSASVNTSESYRTGGASSSAVVEEEPIATYDSDDYQEQDYSNDSSRRGIYSEEILDENTDYNDNYNGNDNYNYNDNYNDSDSENENENEAEEEVTSGGIFGFFKGFGRKKKAVQSKRYINNDKDDDIDSIYSEIDDDDDNEDNEKDSRIMDMFDGLSDDDDEDDDK